MANTIQLRRGLESARSGDTPVLGELLYITDDHNLYIGDGSTAGGLLIANGDIVSTIYVDGSGDVGIGTSTPDAKLHVFTGDTTITPDTDADDFMIECTGDGGMTIATPAANKGTINFADPGDSDIGYIEYDHNTDKMTLGSDTTATMILDGANVGVGTASPTTYVTSTSGIIAGSSTAAASGQLGVLGNQTSDATIGDISFSNEASSQQASKRVVVIRASRTGNDNNADLSVFTASNAGGVTEKIRITNDGAFGVGTTDPMVIQGFDYDTIAGSVVANVKSTAHAVLAAQGAVTARLSLVDTGAAVDDKWMDIVCVSGTTRFVSLTDAGGTEQDNILYLDHVTGNVGIGTGAPGSNLDVDNKVGIDTAGAGFVLLANTTAPASFSGANYDRIQIGFQSDVAVIQTNVAGTGVLRDIQLTSGSNAGVTVDTAGNVGIGTTSPGAELTVSGSADTRFEVVSTTAANACFRVISNGTDFVTVDSGLQSDAYATQKDMIFQPNGGNVGINILTAPASPLEVAGIIHSTTSGIKFPDNTIQTSAATGATTPTTTSWTEVTGTSQSMGTKSGYVANNAALVTLTMPTTAALGETIEIAGYGAGLFKVAQNASQIIHFGNSDTTTGVGGSLTATNRYDSISFRCVVANNEWVVLGSQGSFTVV